MHLDGGGVDLLEGAEASLPERGGGGLRDQGCLPLGSFARNLSVHGEAPPLTHGRGGPLLASLKELYGGFRCQALVVVVIHLDHWGVGAGAEALDLAEGKEAVGSSLAVLDAEVVLNGALDVLRATDHAGGSAAELQWVLERRGDGRGGEQGMG